MPTLQGLEQQLTGLIAQQETAGGTTGVGASLNNPGGIMYGSVAAAQGGTQTSSGFASFPTLQQGYQALTNLIDNYISGGASLSSMMNAYAPTQAGNPTTPARITSLAQATGLDPNAAISTQVTTGTTPAAATTAGAAAPSSGTAATATPAASSIWNSIGQGLAQGLLGPFGSASDSDGFSWARIGTGVVGVILLIMGLMQLRQTQIVVQNVTGAAKRVGKIAGAFAA